MREKKCFIFDLDGTILDTLSDISDAMNHTLKSHGFKENNLTEYKNYLGYGADYLLRKSLNNEVISEHLFSTILDKFKKLYEENLCKKTKPYDGITDLLKKLNFENVLLAVLSNKPDNLTKQMINYYFGDISFIEILGERKDSVKKPEPDSVFSIIKKAGVNKNDAVIIGDSDIDIITAKNAQVKSIAVTWGYRDVNTLMNANPDWLVNSVIELEILLNDIRLSD